MASRGVGKKPAPPRKPKELRRSLNINDMYALASLTGGLESEINPDNVHDLAGLTKLDDEILNDMLNKRYKSDRIYTYVGDILVAVNPFRIINGIYDEEVQEKYVSTSRQTNPPHIFAVADAAFADMLTSNGTRSQCCIVSGESGAGKTESAKHIMVQIMKLCELNSGTSSDSGADLRQKIIAVNPLLEAFGNAQTTKNDNSSRFGKYTELLFNQNGDVLGSDISIYLLEKSRVTSPGGQNDDEQNFHMFYYLFAENGSAEENNLGSPEEYDYLTNIDGVDEINLESFYEEVITAMGLVGFSEEEKASIWAILASILHLGQIEFEGEPDDEATIPSASNGPIGEVIAGLQLQEQSFVESLLGTLITAGGEQVKRKYTVRQALASRDAMARAIYGRLFSWIVMNVNQLLETEKKKDVKSSIGILDIFGFENFAVNSFEQLCINLANEQLQYFFNEHVFELEQQEYRKEGIDLTHISYKDNKPTLDMHLKHDPKSPSMFMILDEESLLQQSTAETLSGKFRSTFGKHSSGCFSTPKGNQPVFSIDHYAGSVTYQAASFIEKNRDNLAHDVTKVMSASSCSITSELFVMQIDEKTGAVSKVVSRKEGATARRKKITEASAKTNATNKRAVTVGKQFRVSLNLLYNAMSKCTPHFVRCIKPNEENVPYTFQDDFVMKQLQYTGMLATTRIRREGFAARVPFEEFINRFRVLGFSQGAQIPISAESCITILKGAKISGYEVGSTKMFLKHYHMDDLDARLFQMAIAARQIQRYYRRYLTRKKVATLFLLIETSNPPIVKMVMAQRDEDVERRDDLRRQIEEERIMAADRRRREREEAESAERARVEKERAELAQRMQTYGSALLQLLERMREMTKIDADNGDEIAAIYSQIMEKHTEIRTQISSSQDRISSLRVDQQNTEKAESEALQERDRCINQIAFKAERGGANAPRAIEALRIKLDGVVATSDELGAQAAVTSGQLLSETLLVEELNTNEKINASRINETLRECNVILRDRVGDTRLVGGNLQAEIVSMRTEREREVDGFRREAKALQENVEELKVQMKSERTSGDKVKVENSRNVDQLKSVIAESETEIETLSATMAKQQRDWQVLKTQMIEEAKVAETKLSEAEIKSSQSNAESLKKVRQVEEQVAVARRNLEDETGRLTDQIRTLESDRESARKRADTRTAALQTTIDEQQAQIEQMSVQVSRVGRVAQNEVADKDDVIATLEAQNVQLTSSQSIARSTQAKLRAEIDEVRLKLEEAEFETKRMADTLAARERTLNSQAVESTAVSEELKKLLAEKQSIGEIRHQEHDASLKKLQEVITSQRNECVSLQDEIAALQQQHSRDMRGKERTLQSQLTEKDSKIHELELSLDSSRSMANTAKAGSASQIEVDRKDGEITLLNAKLIKVTDLYDQLKAQNADSKKELKRILQERTASEEAKAASEIANRSAKDREIRELQTKLTNANTLLHKARFENQQSLAELTKEYDAQIDELEKTISRRNQDLADLAQHESRLRERSKTMHIQIDEHVKLYLETKAELDKHKDTLEQIRLREERDREMAVNLHNQTVKNLEGRLALQSEAQMRNFQKMKKAIVAMAKKRPGHSNPSEGAHVDLVNYMTIINGEGGLPHNMRVGRFTCKSYLVKLAASVEQRRWIVLDLQQKTLSWYVDNRELRISRKGQFALADIQKIVDPGSKNSPQPRAFMVGIPKRTYTFIAESMELKECWLQVFRCILGQDQK